MADVTVVGRGTRIRGRITLGGGRAAAGGADLEIHGYLEGEATIDGEITVEATGLVAGNLSARRIVVRGAVRGDLVAEEAIVLEEGARVVGDIRAPRVAVASGALVRGEVQIGDVDAPKARAATQASTARAPQSRGAAPAQAAPASRNAPAARPAPAPPAAKPQPVIATRPAPTPPPAPPRPTDVSVAASRSATPPTVASSAMIDLDNAPTIARNAGPPAPVVPALKKGAKAALNKKRA